MIRDFLLRCHLVLEVEQDVEEGEVSCCLRATRGQGCALLPQLCAVLEIQNLEQLAIGLEEIADDQHH